MRRPPLLLLLSLLLVAPLGACGVGPSGATDLGDGLVSGHTSSAGVAAPTPKLAGNSPDKLVRYYLEAAVGGGDAGRSQMAAFLTSNVAPPDVGPSQSITVIRLLSVQQLPATLDAVPVTVTYQTVGTLNDQGRVDELADLRTATLDFRVVPYDLDETTLRIDSISGTVPPGLVISDDALTDFYTPHAIYFWDSAYKLLVPDLRYLPRTLSADQQATKVIGWLQRGPSPWLTGAESLSTDTFAETYVLPDDSGRLVVPISAQAALDPALGRLVYQLRWSVDPDREIVLQVEGHDVATDAGADDHVRFNYATVNDKTKQVYDIGADLRVVNDPVAATPSGVLTATVNNDVVWAAVDRSGRTGAFVRTDDNGRRYLTLAFDGGASIIDAALTHTWDMGRPVWVPEAGNQVLVPSGGRLWAVNGATGASTDVTPRNLTGVTAISVSADGRRLALIAAGQAYTASLILSADTVSVSSTLRPLLAGQLDATTLAWTGEAWVTVAGAGPSLWRVSADGVIADDLSGALSGVEVTDIVAYPPLSAEKSADIYLGTPNGVYTLGNTIVPSQRYRSPFFAFS